MREKCKKATWKNINARIAELNTDQEGEDYIRNKIKDHMSKKRVYLKDITHWHIFKATSAATGLVLIEFRMTAKGVYSGVDMSGYV